MPLKLNNTFEKITIDPTKLAYLKNYFSNLIKTKPHTIIRKKHHHSDITCYNELTLTNSELSFELICEPKKSLGQSNYLYPTVEEFAKLLSLNIFIELSPYVYILTKKPGPQKTNQIIKKLPYTHKIIDPNSVNFFKINNYVEALLFFYQYLTHPEYELQNTVKIN